MVAEEMNHRYPRKPSTAGNHKTVLAVESLESRRLLTAICSSGRDDWTVGLVTCTRDASVGYTLVAPNVSNSAYLVDIHGREVNAWTGGPYNSRFAAYLGPDGSLYSSGVVSSGLNGAGATGAIWKQDWDGNVTWNWRYSTSEYKLHHDFDVLPNGNILALAWVLQSPPDLAAAGRQLFSGSGLYTDRIIEVRPTGPTTGEIVWQWDLWDHLIQDADSTKNNFGVVADHPELVDFNFAADGALDWTHLNGISYSAELDQIVLSSRDFNEIWIIDHSTTTAEAATHRGGNSGKGGDLLYRWGNPTAYDTPGPRQLFGQHDAQWIDPTYPGGGNILLFNNGGSSGSELVEIVTPVDVDGNYPLMAGNAFAPDTPKWIHRTGTSSPVMSGTQRLANGNTLAAFAQGVQRGNIREVTPNGDTVWRYINPASNTGAAPQGSLPGNNLMFKSRRYESTYAGLLGRDLTPTGYVEQWQLGDYDLNQAINPSDVDLLCAGLPSGDRIYDLNFDDVVDNADVIAMVTALLGRSMGDANLDGAVDVADFNVWNANKFTPANLWSQGDFNCDGVVDVADFNVWNANKFTLAAVASSDAAVDELSADHGREVTRLVASSNSESIVASDHPAVVAQHLDAFDKTTHTSWTRKREPLSNRVLFFTELAGLGEMTWEPSRLALILSSE